MALPLTSTVVYLAVDELLSPRGRPLHGFESLCYAIAESNIPCVWLTRRSRIEVDGLRRKLGHEGPFIAEDGCGVYLPEGYFHLKPSKPTVRLGRFTCIPIAVQQPAAREALAGLAEEMGMAVVPLRSLSPREIAQNTGLPQGEAELLQHRDFDELFFFAGATDAEIERFATRAGQQGAAVRAHGALRSLAKGASVRAGIRELSALYERALRRRPLNVGVAPASIKEAVESCERQILLDSTPPAAAAKQAGSVHAIHLPLEDPAVWERVLAELQTRHRR